MNYEMHMQLCSAVCPVCARSFDRIIPNAVQIIDAGGSFCPVCRRAWKGRALVLHLVKRYWEQIRDGIKTEEYRLRTMYWRLRLENREYRTICLYHGYPARHDLSRLIVRPYKGYSVRTLQHDHFCPAPVEVFVIKL